MFLSIPVKITATPLATVAPVVQDVVEKNTAVGVTVVVLLFTLFVVVICLASLVLWVYVLAKIISSQVKTTEEKILWLIVVLVLPFLGSILYLLLGRDKVKGKLKSK